MDIAGFPKLTPTPIRRVAVESWLNFYQDVPLRTIAATTGSGKTTAVHLYARMAPHPVRYVRLHAGATLTSFAKSLEHVLETPVSVDRIVEAFPADRRMELVVDEIENADEAVRAVLQALPNRAPSNVTLIYVGRSRRTIDLVPLITQGLAVSMDRAPLAFNEQEAAELCEALDLSYTQRELAQLVYATEGWAFALTGTLRDASYESSGLRGAFARWHERHARLIRHLMERSLSDLSPSERQAAERIYAGQEAGSGPAYAHLHDAGLLLSFSEAELRPLRAITSSVSKQAHLSSAPLIPVAHIEMFGQFKMEVDGRRVEWFRRRDRQIVAFVALQPDATATRRRILDTFWPETEPHLAAQSLRTACSTIRRAIAQCVGYDRVDHYFTVGQELRLNTDYVSITAHRLRTHLHAGDEAYASGDLIVARGHYLAACRLYRSRLLDAEGSEPWLSGHCEEFAQMVATAAERSLEIKGRRGNDDALAATQANVLFASP